MRDDAHQEWQRNVRSDPWVAIVLVVAIAGAMLFYGRGYQYLPGDDSSNTLNGARYIAETHSTNFLHPLNPDLGGPFYPVESLISAEFPLHVALAQVFLIVGTEHVLTVANIFVLSIFALTAVLIYLVCQALLRSRTLALVGVIVMLFSHWYGYSFWSGHYAQLLAYPILLFLIFALQQFSQKHERLWLALAAGSALLLLPIHSLSFLVATATFIGYLLLHSLYVERHRHTRIVYLAMLGGGFLLLLLFTLWFAHTDAYRQLFQAESLQTVNFSGSLSKAFEKYVGVLLLLVGAFTLLRGASLPLLVWLMTTYVLVNSGYLGFPFFADRFVEYLNFPLVLIALLGLRELLSLVRRQKARVLLLVALLALYIPYNLLQQLSTRSCYIAYCEGLNPASILPEDVKAFRWIHEHTPADSTIIAVQKFGNYLPAVAVRKTAVPVPTADGGNAAYRALTATTQRERWEAARELPAQYIIWGAVFDKYQKTYKPYQVYSEQFDDRELFKLVYDEDGVRIYEVLAP